MENVFGNRLKNLQYPEGGIEPISKANKAHTMHLLVLSFIIIGLGIVVYFMLQSFQLIPENRYDESWCKSLLSKHDANVLSMGFDVNRSGVSVVKTNYTIRFSDNSFIAEAVSMVFDKNTGNVQECNLEAISNTGIELLAPKAYSCANDTAYKLSTKETNDYLYAGREITYSLSSPMLKAQFASMNLTGNPSGFVYIDYVAYRTPENILNHQRDIAEANNFINSYCTPSE